MVVVAVCPVWAEHRRILRDVLSDGDLSRPTLVQSMVRSEGDWDAISSCEAVMLAKEEAGTPSREALRASGIVQRSLATVSAGLRTASKRKLVAQSEPDPCGTKSHQTTIDGP
ncbi:hypothetical protein SFRURICE_013521, partial [Spodoptera frugiperda]